MGLVLQTLAVSRILDVDQSVGVLLSRAYTTGRFELPMIGFSVKHRRPASAITTTEALYLATIKRQ